MSGHRKWADIRRSAGPVGEERGKMIGQAMDDAISLAELRRTRQLTQAQVSGAMSMQQSAVSRVERQADLYLSTLRDYVEAMGGELRVEAVFPDMVLPIAIAAAPTPEEEISAIRIGPR